MGLDVPREIGAVIFAQDDVVAEGVDVFGVEEESIHVKQAGPDWGKTVNNLAVWYPEHVIMGCLLRFECCHFCVGPWFAQIESQSIFQLYLQNERLLSLRSDWTHCLSQVNDNGQAVLGSMLGVHLSSKQAMTCPDVGSLADNRAWKLACEV